MAKPLARALKEARIEREFKMMERIFNRLNELCQQEYDDNLFVFIADRERVTDQARMYCVGPYKHTHNNLGED